MAELLPIASGKTTWKLITRTVFNHPARFTYILCLFIASSLVALVTPWQIGLIVDRAIAAELAGFPWRELAFIAAATLANALITRTWIFQAQNLGTQMNKELGIDLVGSALDLDAQTVEDARAGDLVSRVTDDLDSVRQIITMGLPEIIHVLISIFTIVVSIFVLSPALGAMTLPFLVLETCVIAVFLPRIARRIVLRTERISTMTTTVTENVHGAATASELGVVDARARVLERNIWDYYEVADGLVKLRARLWALDSIAAYSPLFLSVAWGAICVRNGWASWGQVSTASILVFTMRTNADIFSYWLDRLREMTVTMGRVSGVIDLARTHRLRRATQRAEHSAGSVVEAQKDAAGAAQTAEFDGAAVRVRELTFGYDPAKPVLEGIDFSLKQGEMVALVGRSGSGKTTLARLMAGSLSASSGTVEVMGESVGNGLYPTNSGPTCSSAPRKPIYFLEPWQIISPWLSPMQVRRRCLRPSEPLEPTG